MGDRKGDTSVSWWMNPQASTVCSPTSFWDVVGAGMEVSQAMVLCCGILWSLSLRG
jgi:hypothetical protein